MVKFQLPFLLLKMLHNLREKYTLSLSPYLSDYLSLRFNLSLSFNFIEILNLDRILRILKDSRKSQVIKVLLKVKIEIEIFNFTFNLLYKNTDLDK